MEEQRGVIGIFVPPFPLILSRISANKYSWVKASHTTQVPIPNITRNFRPRPAFYKPYLSLIS